MRLRALAVAGRGLVDPAEPVFSAGDEALLRGRAAFETTRVYDGRAFRLDAHLVRLAASAARLGLPPPDLDEAERLAGLVAAGDAALRLYWTGETLVASAAEIPPGLDELRARGLRLVSLQLDVDPAARWQLAGVKSTSYAVNMAAQEEAARRGADDAVFVGPGDVVLEAPTSNVWIRRGEALVTPPLEAGVLAGVTRDTLLELAPEHGYRTTEETVRSRDLLDADEVFTSASIREVMPVAELDGRPLRRGEAATLLQAALRVRSGA